MSTYCVSSDEEERRPVEADRELETIGAARRRRKATELPTTTTANTVPSASVCQRAETATKMTPTAAVSERGRYNEKADRGTSGSPHRLDRCLDECPGASGVAGGSGSKRGKVASRGGGGSGGGSDGGSASGSGGGSNMGSARRPSTEAAGTPSTGKGKGPLRKRATGTRGNRSDDAGADVGGGGGGGGGDGGGRSDESGDASSETLRAARNANGSSKRCGKQSTSTAATQPMKRVKEASSSSKSAKKNRPKKVLGIFGIPVDWNVGDCDYDDSEDESYAATESKSRRRGKTAAGSAATNPKQHGKETPSMRKTANTYRRMKDSNDSWGSSTAFNSSVRKGASRRASIMDLSAEVVLNGIVRPFLCATAKCALQRACKRMRPLVDMPEAWESLDLRAEVIGRRTMKSGRQSIMSKQPLFFFARSVVLQPRFSLLKTADLRGLNLGAMGSRPDLLVTLFNHCKHLTTLNLWNTYVEDERLPQPDSAVEELIAENLPGVLHLALEMDASNKGLKLLLKGCRQLRSLHIGTRSNRRGVRIGEYPTDLGMKAFTTLGAPKLEVLSLVDKINIGATGLRCVLDASSCPQLQTLILTKVSRVNDHCLKTISPIMGRVTSLTVDQCEAKPATVQFVVSNCPQLTSLVFCAHNGALEHPQNGRALFNFLLAQGSKNLVKVDVQQPRVDPSRTSDIDAPQWLSEDRALYNTVRDCVRPRIVIGQAETADERIAPFMAGGVDL